MAIYNLRDFTVLVVEDNGFIRRLLYTALKALSVGEVITTAHGGEAIEVLKSRGARGAAADGQPVDIVVSNWQMSPVDGTMLLRWVRRHKESANRFMPFLMVTGYADEDKVAEARDLGVTEFLAKPFSVNTMSERVLSVIDKPRHFLLTAAYFGPDRRRQQLSFEGPDRRVMKEEDMEIIDVR